MKTEQEKTESGIDAELLKAKEYHDRLTGFPDWVNSRLILALRYVECLQNDFEKEDLGPDGFPEYYHRINGDDLFGIMDALSDVVNEANAIFYQGTKLLSYDLVLTEDSKKRIGGQ